MKEDAHNTNRNTWTCAEWIIALFSVPYLLDTAEQDRGLSLVIVKTRVKVDSYQFKKSPFLSVRVWNLAPFS